MKLSTAMVNAGRAFSFAEVRRVLRQSFICINGSRTVLEEGQNEPEVSPDGKGKVGLRTEFTVE